MCSSKLRINYICPLPSLAGGIKSSRLISEALVRRGHDVRIVYPTQDGGGALPSWWRPRSRVNAKKRLAAAVEARKHHHLMHSSATLVPVNATTVRSSDVPDADIAIASWWECIEWICSWPETKGVPVHYIRGHDVHHEQKVRAEAVFRNDVMKITISRWLEHVIKKDYGRDAVVVPNGIDWDQFSTPPREKSRVPVVGFMQGTGWIKDAATAIRACSLVQESIPNLRVVSFGTTDAMGETKVLKDFRYRARPPQDQIASIYSQADCWLISSRSEGLSMPGLEAAACRCPIVATDCGGVADFMLEGRNGHMVPVGDSRTMADRIIEILSLPEGRWKAMSDASYQSAQQFNWDTSAERLEGIFMKLRQGQRTAVV